MNLFIDSLSSPACLILFNETKNIIQEKHVDIAFNESSKLSGEIASFLGKANITCDDIENIIVTHGPGSFTGVRTVVLIANTIAFRSNTRLTPINYFELFDSFPVIKCSSKRDVFIKKSQENKIEILTNDACNEYLQKSDIKNIWGDFDKIEKKDILITSTPCYERCIGKINLQNNTQIEPLYIKKPNIS